MWFAVACAAAVIAPSPQGAPPPTTPTLVILAPTGDTQDGLPVMERINHPAAVQDLTRGFSGRLLRLFVLQQEYLRRSTGRPPQPAYLALTDQTGGFPRVGFVLDGVPQPEVGWVDLRRTTRFSGRHGATDQIFPHELLHVIAMQLAGPPRRGGSTQVHALGVRTDPVMAFHEGFAEHVQVMAIDDPDALPDTAALRDDDRPLALATDNLHAYARDLARPWSAVSRQRIRFPFWYSSAEQVQRYFGVKANTFAKHPEPPAHLPLLEQYLWRSVIAGGAQASTRPASVQLSIDGPVAHLFWRIATDHSLQTRYRDADFYTLFGVSPADVTPLENIYLKMFATLAVGRTHTTADFIATWATRWPEDADDLNRIVLAALGTPLPNHAPIWLANPHFVTGTTVFDQFASMPRTHTFDANAAEVFDWMTVPGMTGATARVLVDNAPFASFDALTRTPGVDAALASQLSGMRTAMEHVHEADSAGAESLSIVRLLRGLIVRGLLVVAIATVLAATILHLTLARPWLRAIGVSALMSAVVCAAAWSLTANPWVPPALVAAAAAVPAALVSAIRHRSVPRGARAALTCSLACLPAAILTWPW